MSLLVIGRVPKFQVLGLPVLVNPIEPKLRQVVCEDTVRVVQAQTSELNLSFWWILRIYRRRLVGVLKLPQKLRIQHEFSQAFFRENWSRHIGNLLVGLTNLINQKRLQKSLNRYLERIHKHQLAVCADKLLHICIL
jgi:hypothetical protein